MAKSGWRGPGGASDGRVDLAPRRQRRLERKRANDKRHLNHPKAWAYVVNFQVVAILFAKRFRKVLAAGPAPPIAEKNQRCKCSSLDVQNSFLILLALLHFLGPIDLRQRAVARWERAWG